MRIDVPNASDDDLKCRGAELLAYGILPIEQWANVFANPNFSEYPGLRAKAFSVWFTTMIDYIQGEDEARVVQKELSKRGVETAELFDLYGQLVDAFRSLLSIFSSEEQIFLRDRRLQNVHGRLQLNTYEEHDIPIYDASLSKIRRIQFTAAEYREMMQSFYSQLAEKSEGLLNRAIESQEFTALTELYKQKLVIGEHFSSLLVRLDVQAAAGSG